MERPICVERAELDGIPVLHVYDRTLTGPAPTVFFYHGWCSRKEYCTIPAEILAIDGFRVILPDQIHHGERDPLPDYNAATKTHFWPVILQSIEEADRLCTAAVATNWAAPDRMAVAGSSMGGFVAAGVLARHAWARAAALLNGCPSFCWAEAFYTPQPDPTLLAQLQPFDPEQQLPLWAPKPLLMLHGDADTSVPIGGVRHFKETAASAYAACPEQLALTEIPRLDHFVTSYMLEAMRNWFVRWI